MEKVTMHSVRSHMKGLYTQIASATESMKKAEQRQHQKEQGEWEAKGKQGTMASKTQEPATAKEQPKAENVAQAKSVAQGMALGFSRSLSR